MLPSLDRAFWPRLAVTAAVLAAFRLGSLLPLPGLDASALQQLAYPGGLALERVSILALSVMPLINALILVEVLKLIAPGIRRWETEPQNGGRLHTIVVGLALFMALLQGIGYAGALEQVTHLVIAPGTQFRTICVATLVAGTALTIAFINVIDRAGLGYGLWLLFITTGLAELPRNLASIAVLNMDGSYSTEYVILAAVFSVIAIAGVVSLVLAAHAAPATLDACLWTPMIALAAVPLALFAVGFAATFSVDAALKTGAPDHLAWYVALAAAVLLVAWLYERSYALAGLPNPVPAMPIAATLAVILIASLMLQKQLGILLPLNGTQLIVAAVIATAILITWGRPGEAEPAPEEELSPRA